MMNFHLALRKRKQFCEPIGPSFAKAKLWNIIIEGTQIAFKAPDHKPMVKGRSGKYPDKNYTYDDMIFRSTYREELDIADEWEATTLFYHDWAFNGPWFIGCVAHVHAEFRVLKRKVPNDNISLFHPRAFELTIGEYLTNAYSKIKFEGQYEYITPIEWQPLENWPVSAVRLQVVKNEAIACYDTIHYVFFPLDNQHIGVFYFHPSRSASCTKAEVDRQIGDKNINTLIDNIISSVKITPSSRAQEQMNKALKGLVDISLTKEFLPMNWKNTKSSTAKSEIDKPILQQ